MSERYGLYRAKVVQRDDDRQRGRIKVQIPSIMGEGKSQWVEACMNTAYDNGGDIAIPKIGDTVWIAFEEGDINRPVYMGNFFSAFKTPLRNYDQDTRVISWDKCRIEMKGETMTITVGDSTVVTLTGSTITANTSAHIEMNAGRIDLNP